MAKWPLTESLPKRPELEDKSIAIAQGEVNGERQGAFSDLTRKQADIRDRLPPLS
jgi:hypothetical protein